MNLQDFKQSSLGIDRSKLGKIYTFVDFGNVNYWFGRDQRDAQGNTLEDGSRIIVDIVKLGTFLDLFSIQKRFYYGWHTRMPSSQHINILAQKSGFIKITKPIQFIRHHLNEIELTGNTTRTRKEDALGQYIEIPKSNFDVEISVDAIRLMDKYDTFCLLSGDSDFAHLTRFLKRKHKKIMIVASGQVFHTLKETADVYINAQKIKSHITRIKKPRS